MTINHHLLIERRNATRNMTGTRRKMRSHDATTEAIATVGTNDNVFEALNLPDANERLAKAELGRAITHVIKGKKLTQT